MIVELQPVTSKRARRAGAEPRSPGMAAEERPAFDRDYWLAHCEGYRVDAADGRLGFVDEVRPQPGGGPPTLAIRAGRLGRRLLLVSASEAAFVVPRARRIWLRSPVAISSTEAAGPAGRAIAPA